MGIGGFQRWLVSTFPEIVRVQGNRFGEVYDHVAFDLNQVLHQAARKASDRHTLAAAIFRELDGILKNCVPRKSIFFAFDGPGPVAKLVTQRKRRNRARVEHVTVPRRRRGKTGKAYAVQSIDRLELTPGVETLYYLRDAIEYWTYTRLQNDRKYTNVEVRISGPDVPGEGELKIIDFCRIGIESRDESVIVVGGDADIVLQGLATMPIRDFFVYLRNFGNHGRKRVNYVLSVWELTRSLERLFPGDSKGARLDFILLSTMNGNDYIPKARGVSLSRLWRRYISLKRESSNKSGISFKGQFIIDSEKRTFNWPFLYRLLERVGAPVTALTDLQVSDIATNGSKRAEIVQSEDGDISSEEIVYTGDENGIPMMEIEFSDDEWGDNNSDDDDDDDDDDDSTNASNLDDDDEQHFQTLLSLTEPAKLYDVERWLRMLLWTLHMYVDGHCPDYAFQYGRPYGPSCDLITGFIEDHNGDPFTISAPIANTPPLHPHTAALAMLPKHAVHLLPRPLQRLVTDSETSKRIFPNANVVDVNNLIHEVGNVRDEEYEKGELRLTRLGHPIWLRLARGRAHAQNFRIEKPGARFEDIKRFPAVQRAFFDVTDCPRCYPWILGEFRNVLGREYKRVGGAKLTVTVR